MSSRWISISASAWGRASLSLDQGTLAHAASAPQKGVVGRPPRGKALGVGEQDVAHPIDADQQFERHARYLRDRAQLLRLRLPHERIARLEVRLGAQRRLKALDRSDQAQQHACKIWSHRTRRSLPWALPRQARICGAFDQATARRRPQPLQAVRPGRRHT